MMPKSSTHWYQTKDALREYSDIEDFARAMANYENILKMNAKEKRMKA